MITSKRQMLNVMKNCDGSDTLTREEKFQVNVGQHVEKDSENLTNNHEIEVKLYVGGKVFTEEVQAANYQDAKVTATARNPRVKSYRVSNFHRSNVYASSNIVKTRLNSNCTLVDNYQAAMIGVNPNYKRS